MIQAAWWRLIGSHPPSSAPGLNLDVCDGGRMHLHAAPACGSLKVRGTYCRWSWSADPSRIRSRTRHPPPRPIAAGRPHHDEPRS